MNKKLIALIMIIMWVMTVFAGCNEYEEPVPYEKGNAPVEDGVYSVDFDTDSSMFHVNEICNGKGTLTVQNGFMTLHIIMPSKNIENLFLGTAEAAQKDGAKLINPTTEKVTYSDGITEEVFAFDIPVEILGEEFDLALIGTKGKWYDHKVTVSNPASNTAKLKAADLEDGDYTVSVSLKGGSGKATVESPTKLTVLGGECKATIVWSSEHYEYMVVSDTQYDKINKDGNSTMEIPVVLDEDMEVSALTTAMSEPHLIDYTLHFDSATIKQDM